MSRAGAVGPAGAAGRAAGAGGSDRTTGRTAAAVAPTRATGRPAGTAGLALAAGAVAMARAAGRAAGTAALLAATIALGGTARGAGAAGDGEPLRAETRNGPVTATVTLAPGAPRLGDRMVLTLAVEAEPGTRVEMPAFGDALGRFTIVDFAPRDETVEGGGSRLSHRYTLQAMASGRHRIPALRLEFVDARPGRGDGASRELLTEELAFEVASVLPEEMGSTELRPARPALPELADPWWERHGLRLAGALAVLAAGVAAVAAVLRRRRSPERTRASAFERASGRLARLRAGGLPEGAGADPWYVELSDIVRRYVEERFSLRAPELTTEEFLLEAGRSAELSAPHRALLSDFLERCDRVKFARYRPGAGESREALEVAERFLAESRAPDRPAEGGGPRGAGGSDGGPDGPGGSGGPGGGPDGGSGGKPDGEPGEGGKPDGGAAEKDGDGAGDRPRAAAGTAAVAGSAAAAETGTGAGAAAGTAAAAGSAGPPR